MEKVKNVIVFVEFEEYELKIVAFSAALARILGAEVTLMHVLHTGYDYLEVGGYGKSIEIAYERALSRARHLMDEYIQEVSRFYDVKFHKKLAMGHPLDEFINFTNLKKGIAVLPNYHKTARLKFTTPKITHKALRKLNTNMIFVNGEFLPRIDRISISKILVPIDFSEYSKSALRFAATLAAKNGAQIHAISVIHPPRLSPELFEDIKLDYQEFISVLEREVKNKLDNLIKECVQECRINNITSEVLEGQPPDVILELSREKFDLIAMGIKGRSLSEKLLVGSVTEQVVELSDIPVAVIRSF